LRKHVNVDHYIIFLKIKEEVNNLLREDEKKPTKKKPNMFSSSISNFFFLQKNLSRNMICCKNNGISNYQKPSFFVVCGKYLVKTI
jgi:hypothetical protein